MKYILKFDDIVATTSEDYKKICRRVYDKIGESVSFFYVVRQVYKLLDGEEVHFGNGIRVIARRGDVN